MGYPADPGSLPLGKRNSPISFTMAFSVQASRRRGQGLSGLDPSPISASCIDSCEEPLPLGEISDSFGVSPLFVNPRIVKIAVVGPRS